MRSNEAFAEMLADIRRHRDELGVQIHLAGAEIRDQWRELEQRWLSFSGRLRQSDESSEIRAALQRAARELHRGYARIHDAVRRS